MPILHMSMDVISVAIFADSPDNLILLPILLYRSLSMPFEGLPDLAAEGVVHYDWRLNLGRQGRRVDAVKGTSEERVFQSLRGGQAFGWVRLEERAQEAHPLSLEIFRGPSQLLYLLIEVCMDRP